MNPLDRARIGTRRELIRQGYGSLYERIHEILIRHNPVRVDVSRGDARDDYGLAVGTLIPRLNGANERDLNETLFVEMQHWYREQAGQREEYASIADEIWQAWTEFRLGQVSG